MTAALRLWFLLLVPGVVAVQRDIDRRYASEQSRLLELTVWSGDTLRRLAPGFEDALADLYWLRTVQYYGGERAYNPGSRFPLLKPLVDVTTALDPRLELAYRYGAVFLAEQHPVGAGDPEAAVAILERGVANNPRSWRLRWDLGYFTYLFLKDTDGAVEILLAASKLPDAPPWLETLAGSVAAKGGERATAKKLWMRIYEQAEAEQIQANALYHLEFLAALDLMDQLDAALASFAATRGRPPERLEELVAAGEIAAIPKDPSGVPFRYDPDRGRVFLRRESKYWRAQSEERKLEG